MRRGYETTDADTYKLLLEKAKEMRKMPTEAESLIWKYLATNKTGFHFRRQHPICGYIPDFVCIKKRLIVEIDGGYHFEEEQPKIDAERTKWLNNNGYKVEKVVSNGSLVGNIEEDILILDVMIRMVMYHLIEPSLQYILKIIIIKENIMT